MRWMTALTVFLLLSLSPPVPARDADCPEQGECRDCHQAPVEGAHAGLDCRDCHGRDAVFLKKPSARSAGARGCLHCHPESRGVLKGPMATRQIEKQVVR